MPALTKLMPKEGHRTIIGFDGKVTFLKPIQFTKKDQKDGFLFGCENSVYKLTVWSIRTSEELMGLKIEHRYKILPYHEAHMLEGIADIVEDVEKYVSEDLQFGPDLLQRAYEDFKILVDVFLERVEVNIMRPIFDIKKPWTDERLIAEFRYLLKNPDAMEGSPYWCRLLHIDTDRHDL